MTTPYLPGIAATAPNSAATCATLPTASDAGSACGNSGTVVGTANIALTCYTDATQTTKSTTACPSGAKLYFKGDTTTVFTPLTNYQITAATGGLTGFIATTAASSKAAPMTCQVACPTSTAGGVWVASWAQVSP